MFSGAYILTYFAYHPLLCSGQLKRQAFLIESVEVISDFCKSKTGNGFGAGAAVAQYVKLQVKQLFKFESEACFLQFVGVSGGVYAAKGVSKRHKLQSVSQLLRKRVVNVAATRQKGVHHIIYGTGGNATVA